MSNEHEKLSAYEKAALDGIDPRCIPQYLTEPPPEGDSIIPPFYTPEEIETWTILYNRQMNLLQGRACTQYLAGIRDIKFSANRVPALKEISRILTLATGWQIARVPGLIHEKDFFGLLKRKVFPSTDYIRQRHELNYTPAPDMFHDVFGHTPLLTNPAFASFYQKFGIAALHAKPDQHILLERLHWFTVEFGLIQETAGRRIYGAGIVSSSNEVEHALSEEVVVLPFSPERVVAQEYEVWHLQPVLFIINSFEQLESDFTNWAKKENLLD